MNHRFLSRFRSTGAQSGRLLVPAALVLSCGLLLQATAAGSQEKAPQADTAKAQDDATQQEKPAAGRGRLSGRKTPPKPASVPTGGRAKAKPAPAVQPQPGSVPQGKAPVQADQKKLTPEQEKQRAAYEAKLKASGGKEGAGKGRAGAAPRPPRNPNAKVEIPFGSDVHDFGRARQGDLLTHVFQLTSAGTEPLVISQVSPTCGCTLGEVRVLPDGAEVASVYKFGESIEPGTKVEIEATLNTASKRNKTNVRINVYSNDGKTGVTQLSLSANVEPFIVATPQFLQLGDIREGTETSGTIDFRTSGSERILLTPNSVSQVPLPQGLTMDLIPMNPDEEGKSNHWRASFLVAADSTEGGKSYAVRLNSDIELPKNEKAAATSKKKPGAATVYQVNSNVNYRILGALSLQPQYVSLGLVRPGQPVVRNVRLTCHEQDFDLSGVEVTITGEAGQPLNWADRFQASVKPVSGSNAVDIELRLEGLPDEADGSFRGRVVIKTGHPAKPEEFFRFSGVCRKLAGSAGAPAKRGADAQKKGAVK